jgi:predicted DNA-binding transcriptional regulator YafY
METKSHTTLGELLQLFRDGHALTKNEAAQKLNLGSERHVLRLINELRDGGIEVKERWRDGRKEFHLPASELGVEGTTVSLTERQALALVVAAEAGRAALKPTPLAGPLEESFDQLLGRLDRASGTYDLARLRRQWHFGTEPTASAFDPGVFETLVEALNRGRPVQIEYDSAHSSDAPRERTVSPLVMAAPGGSWRCVAFCHYREAPRDFTLSRIEDVVLDTSRVAADPPEGFDPDVYFRERFGDLSGDPEIVRLRVEPEATRYFQEKSYHPTQVIEEPQEDRRDSRIIVSFEVAGLEDIASWVRSWGTSVTVIDPPELADKIREDIRALAERYGVSKTGEDT